MGINTAAPVTTDFVLAGGEEIADYSESSDQEGIPFGMTFMRKRSTTCKHGYLFQSACSY